MKSTASKMVSLFDTKWFSPQFDLFDEVDNLPDDKLDDNLILEIEAARDQLIELQIRATQTSQKLVELENRVADRMDGIGEDTTNETDNEEDEQQD
jgi:hypothetical protein